MNDRIQKHAIVTSSNPIILQEISFLVRFQIVCKSQEDTVKHHQSHPYPIHNQTVSVTNHLKPSKVWWAGCKNKQTFCWTDINDIQAMMLLGILMFFIVRLNFQSLLSFGTPKHLWIPHFISAWWHSSKVSNQSSVNTKDTCESASAIVLSNNDYDVLSHSSFNPLAFQQQS